MQKEYTQTKEQVLEGLRTDRQGLSAQEAEKRLREHGENRLKEAEKLTLFQRFVQQLKDPMLLILLAAAAVSAVTNILSHESFTEVIIILLVVLLNAILGVVQESKAEAAIEALQTMTAATCKVLRDGQQVTMESRLLVPGDVVLLEAGDAVPADGRILESASMKIEEAALTGESVPVSKFTEPLAGEQVSLGDRKNMAYMGSAVVYGRGRMVVTATGMDTEMGKIAGVLAQTEQEETPLQRKLTQLGSTLSKMVLAICVFIFVFDLLVAGSLTLESVLETFMVAVSLAVAAIPEGLATVVTVVLSIGVTKMSQHNAVIRRLTAVETLGCTQVICSDKTGTLTQNKMTVVEHTGPEGLLGTAMTLCNDAVENPDGTVQGEPTEAALVRFGVDSGLDKNRLEQEQPRAAEAPFDSSRKMMSTIHRMDNGFIQYTKGAPDEVLRRCSRYEENGQMLPMTEEKRQEILAQNKAMADKALRVLAAAIRLWEGGLPKDDSPEYLEQDLCFVGLAGMIDPVRPEVKAAIQQCRTAGIRPVMITGDHKDTAVAIAKELGILDDPSQAVTGSALDSLSDEELAKEVEKYSVYARVQPEHKVRIVHAWRKRGAVTAMTGDGVNDAPSIKSADIGVGMGITGTDVTKNVADMVLADDNFATIVGAVGEGRRIYDNIRKAIPFLLASNMSEVLGVFVPTLLGFTLLNPVHLLFINLLTDSLPAIALGLEPHSDAVMREKPRPRSEGILTKPFLVSVGTEGLVIALATIIAFHIGLASGGAAVASTMAFATLTFSQLFHAFDVRSETTPLFRLGVLSNKAMNKAFLAGAALQAAVLLAKLDAFEGELDAVNEAAALYSGALAESGLALPEVPEGYRSSWAQYTVRLPEGLDRDALQAALKERGVPTMVYYPKPMHGQGAFEGAHLGPDGCPVTKRLCETVLSLPMGPYLTADEVLSAVHFIDKWLVE